MFIYLSKILPMFVYPLGLVFLILLIASILKPESKWVKRGIITALVIIMVGGNNWVSTALVRSLEWRYLPPEEVPSGEVIVVLGGGTGSALYPRQMVELDDAADRVFYGSWLYHEGAAPRILLTGGYIPFLGNNEGSPAENMAIVLEMLGVPKEALILDDESLNTYENALYSKDILDNMGISEIILVTSAQHMPRSVALFEKLELEVIPAPTDYSVTQAQWEDLWAPNLKLQVLNFIPSVGNLSATTGAMKEYLGMLVYWLRGWI